GGVQRGYRGRTDLCVVLGSVHSGWTRGDGRHVTATCLQPAHCHRTGLYDDYSFVLRKTERRGALARGGASASDEGNRVVAFSRLDLRRRYAPVLFSGAAPHARIHGRLPVTDATACS